MGDKEVIRLNEWVHHLRRVNGQLTKALQEIVKGEGRFSMNPMIHAENTIENMKAIANEALGESTNGSD